MGTTLVAEHGFLTVVSSLMVEHKLYSTGSVVVAHGISCSAACGNFVDQGLNLYLLQGVMEWTAHWQADPLPLSHQGNPDPQILGQCLENSNLQSVLAE